MPKEVKWAISIAIGLCLLVLGWRFYFVLVTLHILVCGLLIIVVLLQSGKAADLAGAFGGAGSQTAVGPRGAATILSLASSWCAVMFMVCAMALGLRTDRAVEQGGGAELQNVSKRAPNKAPAKPPATP